MTAADPEHSDDSQRSPAFGRRWYWLVIIGIIGLIGGLLALANPFAATLTALVITAWAFLLLGAFQLVHAWSLRGTDGMWWALVIGVLGLVLGIWLLQRPLQGIVSLTIVVGACFAVAGVTKMVWAFRLRPGDGWVWLLLAGAVSLALALVVFGNLTVAARSLLGFLLAVDLMSTGLMMLVAGLTLRQVHGLAERLRDAR